jgi:4-hydroxy-3-methylbut-2-enyl diphosphate reductase
MNILRAEHLGMCFGVRDAIALAREQARRGPLTVLGDLVHNANVIEDLRARGVRVAQRPEEVQTQQVMVTAHGASDRAKARTRALGLQVIEATCPLVHLAHRALHKLVNQAFHPVIIGKHDHVEVRGMTGDLDAFDVVLTEEDVSALPPKPRLGIVAQTTQPIERVRHLVRLIQQRFPESEVRFTDTVCQPTKQRQHAAVELAQRCDVVVVIGGASSNNTHELAATSRQYCSRVHHVQTAADLQPAWFLPTDTVGITAGTSTPDSVIQGVEHQLKAWAAWVPHDPVAAHAH